jgi:hypothetical protein
MPKRAPDARPSRLSARRKQLMTKVATLFPDLNDLLRKNGIDPEQVVVLRHSPKEPRLNRVIGHLAANRPDLFNAYQQTQSVQAEQTMKNPKARYIASFIGHEPGNALFVGLYAMGASRPLTREEYWQIPACVELKEKYGMIGFSNEDTRFTILWFDLILTDLFAEWHGRLVIEWPGLERSWCRWADRNTMPILMIYPESKLELPMPDWKEIVLGWEELTSLPPSWETALKEWRAIYVIRDKSDRKAYVGSAYGKENLLGRWRNYADSGHGDNVLLKKRDPRNFSFHILERLNPDATPEEVQQVEASWKLRLDTYDPEGLNGN